MVYLRWPEAKLSRVHVYDDRLEVREPTGGLRSGAWFKLPGLKYDVEFRLGEGFWILPVDQAAFEVRYGGGAGA